jgi:hypothetical protein
LSLAKSFKSLLLGVKSAVAHVLQVLVPHICHMDALSTVYLGRGRQVDAQVLQLMTSSNPLVGINSKLLWSMKCLY